MNTEKLGNSKLLNLLFKPAGLAMESRVRRMFHDPVKILSGANVKSGQTVLEVGSVSCVPSTTLIMSCF